MEDKAPKLSFREKLGYGLGTASVNLIFNVVSTYLLFFYTNVYGLKPADAATMFLVVRIIDAVASPIYGTWVDKRTTKYGKYKGYLLYLSVPYAILSILCFVTPNTGYVFKLIYAYTTYVGLSLLNTFLSPMGAMPAAMTRDSNEIAQVNSYGTFCSKCWWNVHFIWCSIHGHCCVRCLHRSKVAKGLADHARAIRHRWFHRSALQFLLNA